MRANTLLGITLLLSACASDDAVLRKTAENGKCGLAGRSMGLDVYEMPPEDLGDGHVGILTLYGHKDDAKVGRYSMVQCRTAQVVRVDSGTWRGDLREAVEILRSEAAFTSLDNLASYAPTYGLLVTRGTVRRSDDSRAGCACLQFYPDDWYRAAPSSPDGRRPFLPR